MTYSSAILAISQLNRNIFDNYCEIILSFIMEVKHCINIVLIFPEIQKENDRCTYRDDIEYIHDIVVIAVISI